MKQVELKIHEFVSPSNTRVMGLHLSSYDVPRGADAVFDESSGVLTVRFRYIDEEPAHRQLLEDQMFIESGKKSGKILSIEIPVKSRKIGEVRLTVSNAVRALSERIAHTDRFNQRENYQLVQSLIQQNTAILASTTTQ